MSAEPAEEQPPPQRDTVLVSRRFMPAQEQGSPFTISPEELAPTKPKERKQETQ